MNPAPSSMSAMLAGRPKDLLCGVEFYLPTYTPSAVHGFEPNQAEALFATETATYVFSASVTVNYIREVFEMPNLSRTITKQSNSVTVKLSNIPKSATPTVRPLADFVLNNDIEGMRMVIRTHSRANLSNPLGTPGWTLFVGRCGPKSDGFNRESGSITARQDLGQIEAKIPPQVFIKGCPLDFGFGDCLGTELLTDKNAAYQAAFAALGRHGCNKTHGQCDEFENLEFNQGLRLYQIEGSFIHRPNESFLQKLAGLLTAGSGRRRMTVGQSLEDGTPYGKAIPIVLGRWQMHGIPLQYRDDGETLRWKMAFARGPIAEFYEIRCNNPEFSPPIDLVKHYGRYGGETSQLADAAFPGGNFHSRLAYMTGGVIGSDIAVEDPAPSISSIVAGISAPFVTLLSDSVAGEGTTDSAGVYNFSGAWSDNPVDLAVFVLTDPALLNFGGDFFDEERTAKTSVYTLGAVRDNTNAERLVLPDTETSSAGVEFHRYNSTGVIICSGSSGAANNGPMFAGPGNEVDYEFFDPDAPPDAVALKTRYRKRYSFNFGMTEQRKALDFFFDTLLPSFRGFLSWDTKGRVAIRCERPSDSSLIRVAASPTDATIKIDDVLPWKLQLHENNIPLIGKILIGVGLTTSEVRSVTAAAYTADGNSITLTASGTGGTTATASGATFTGGSSTVRASATVTIGGTFADNNTVSAVINGETVTYTLEGTGYNAFKVANCLAFAINANPIIQKYVVAHCPVLSDAVELYSKQGVLTLSSALNNSHAIGQETIRVMMSFAGQVADFIQANVTVSNILDGTFKYLGNDGQTRYNQFNGKFHDPLRDFAAQEVIVNDYDHQEAMDLTKSLEIDLAGVDNYWQASHVLNGAAAKHGDGTEFFQWGSNGLALQLEEGDVVCVSDSSGGFINVPVRVESLTVNSTYEVTFKARIYSTSMYDDFVEQTDVPLPSKTSFGEPPSGITFNTVDFPPNGLVQSTDGSAGITSIRGGAIFTTRRNATHGFVRLIKRAGVTVNEQVAQIFPDDNLEAVFEFIASAAGEYVVELEACNQWGCNTTKPTATIFIGLGANQGLWTTPMVQFSGAGAVDATGGGSFNIP